MLKKSIVIKRKRMNLPKFEFKNLFFYILFLCGFLIGLLTVKNGDENFKNSLKDFLTEMFKSYETLNFLSVFLSSLITFLIFPFFSYIFGLCAVGIPIILFLPITIGLTSGLLIGIFYSLYALQGLGFSALIIIPSITIITATLIKCCGVSLNMSIEAISLLSGFSSPLKNQNQLKEYSLSFLVLCLPLIVASLLFSGSFKLFIDLFDFV